MRPLEGKMGVPFLTPMIQHRSRLPPEIQKGLAAGWSIEEVGDSTERMIP
jgi:hypothetical protein